MSLVSPTFLLAAMEQSRAKQGQVIVMLVWRLRQVVRVVKKKALPTRRVRATSANLEQKIKEIHQVHTLKTLSEDEQLFQEKLKLYIRKQK